MTPDELEDRLIAFAVKIIEISELLKKTVAAKNMSAQIARSGTSPALNYGEARSAESKKDFVHKAKIVLKELRETRVSLKIIQLSKLYTGKDSILKSALDECNELISIFVSSTKTASAKRR